MTQNDILVAAFSIKYHILVKTKLQLLKVGQVSDQLKIGLEALFLSSVTLGSTKQSNTYIRHDSLICVETIHSYTAFHPGRMEMNAPMRPLS